VLDRVQLHSGVGDVGEFGCGYGTLTMPAARRSQGTVYAFDIEPEMVALTALKAHESGLTNIAVRLRDFAHDGTGLPTASAEYAMLFNILHAENPGGLLREAWRVLSPRGVVGIMHWNYDPATPRGPSMAIRPRPDQCRDWATEAGFRLLAPGIVALPRFHYGMALEKPAPEF
jgi:SAM-dependent methyltransferase